MEAHNESIPVVRGSPANAPMPGNVPAELVALHPFGLVAGEAAALAGALISTGWSQDRASLHVQEKSRADYVTDIDRQADAVLHRVLGAATPQFKIISEELASGEQLGDATTWIVDPLDGTSCFVHRTSAAQPAVLVALAESREVVLAVAHFPLTGEWFFAARGAGAFESAEGRVASRLPCGAYAAPPLDKAWVTLNQYGDRGMESAFFEHARDRLRAPGSVALLTIDPPHSGAGVRAVSSGSDLCAVLHDGNPLNPKQMIWDIAAVKLIVEEAGGAYLDQSGRPCQLDHAGPIIVARTPALAAELITLISASRH